MNLRLKRERIEYLSCSLNRTAEDAFTTDAVVPDALPDASEVIFTNGDFCLWRLDLSDGTAEAEGEWKGSVCYRAEETGKLCSFPVSVGVRMRMHDDKIASELKPFANFQVTELTGQLMNSRKVRIRVRVKMSLRAYGSKEMEYSTGSDEEAEDLFLKTERASCSVITSVEEQVFTAADQFSLRSVPQDGILSASSEVISEPPLRSGARAVLRGRVLTHLLYLSQDTSSPAFETVETSFSQILDIRDAPGSETLVSGLQLTSSSVQITDDGSLETEFHIVAQTICVHDLQITALTDAYSVTDALEMERESLPMEQWIALDDLQGEAEARISVSSEPFTVIASSFQPRSFQKTEHGYSGSVAVSVMIRTMDEQIREYRAEAPWVMEATADHDVFDLKIDPPSFLQTGDQLCVQISVIAHAVVVERKLASCVQSIIRNGADSTLEKLPSLTLVHVDPDEELWDVAKRYGSSIDAIQAANPHLQEGEVLRFCLIPRIVVR